MEIKNLCKSKVRRYELAGVPIVYALACFLHYLYDLTGGSALAAVFAAANESVWEHVKIFAVAYLAYSAVEYFLLKIPFRSFIAAKTAGVYFLIFSIIVFFYTYTALLGRHVLAIDLISSFIWVAAAFFISCKIIECGSVDGKRYAISLFAMLLFIACYLSFTVNPPEIELFRDPVTGDYGMPVIGTVFEIPV